MMAMIVISLVMLLAASAAAETCSTPSGPGECRNTADCPSAGGTSVAGYCPGPTNIQCCVYQNCNAASGPGKCKPVSECGTTTVSGLCPGPATTKCCLSSNPAGQDCNSNYGPGTCKSTAACSGTGVSIPGYCAGAADIQCCVPNGAISCSTPSGTGNCRSASTCAGTSLGGYCPGPASFQCCITGAPSSGGGPCAGASASRAGLAAIAKGAAASGKIINYTQGGSRWSGITGRHCYPSLPPYADCSSFVTWVYWNAFGNQPDYLNGQSWSAGYTGTLASRGTAVTLASAQPGDLVFYGNPIFHVSMYVGNSQVVSFGSQGPAQLKSIGSYSSIRAYTAFTGI